MIEFIKALILGIIQGITEWLPISSTAHLILLNDFLKLNVSDTFWDLFLVVIQLGSILAVVILYFNTLNPYAYNKDLEDRKKTFNLWFLIIIASIPLVLGAILDDYISDSSFIIALTLIIYGFIFIIVENSKANKIAKIESINEIDYKTAFLIGIFQLLAIVPGTSRSGATIVGSLILGLSRVTAAEFSFFLAIPAMFGASGLKLLKYIIKVGFSFSFSELAILFTATLTSFIVSILVIQNLLKYIRKHDFKLFAIYRIILGIIILTTIFIK